MDNVHGERAKLGEGGNSLFPAKNGPEPLLRMGEAVTLLFRYVLLFHAVGVLSYGAVAVRCVCVFRRSVRADSKSPL